MRLDREKRFDSGDQVARLAKQGLNAKQMSERMGVARDTVIRLLKITNHVWIGSPWDGVWHKAEK
jgi:hypothetical protein